jgi:hypothetical protein
MYGNLLEGFIKQAGGSTLELLTGHFKKLLLMFWDYTMRIPGLYY